MRRIRGFHRASFRSTLISKTLTIVAEMVAMAETLFGRTIIRCRPNSPRCLLPYRIKGREKRESSSLRLRAANGNSRARATIRRLRKHPSGIDYDWQGSPSTRSRSPNSRLSTPPDPRPPLLVRAALADCREGEAERSRQEKRQGRLPQFLFHRDVEAALKQLRATTIGKPGSNSAWPIAPADGFYPLFLEWSRRHPQYESTAMSGTNGGPSRTGFDHRGDAL